MGSVFMKKRDAWKLFLLFLVMGLMGCGGKANENPDRNEQEKEQRRQELTLWSYYETKAQREGLDKLVWDFNESQKDYWISWEYVPMSDFVKTLSFSQSGDKLPDLILADNPDMSSLIKVGLLADITGELEETADAEYYPEVWKFVEDNGHCYGVPFCCNNTAIIYNKQMFDEKNLEIPSTWDEFKKAAAALTEEGSHYGFAMSAVSGEQGAFQFMPWMLAAGAQTEDMADDNVIESFRLMDSVLKEKSMPNDCMNWSQNDLSRSFLAGEIAMMENGPWSLASLDESGIDYGIFRFPANVTTGVVLGGEVLAAVAGMNVEGAISFIDYYNRKGVMEDICQITGNIPPKTALAESFGEKNPNYQVFVEQMEYGICRKSVRDWKNVCNAISDSLNKIFGSEEDIEEIWEEYVDSIENNYGNSH